MNPKSSEDFYIEPADYEADRADLRAVRETVFVHEQKVPLDLEWDDQDPLCHHMIARDAEHRPIGTGRLTPERKIGRMAVLREWRGRGVGEALLRALIEQAHALGWPEVTLHAQASAVGFYQKLGFAPYGERFEEAGIAHQKMRLRIEQSPTSHPALRKAMDVEYLDEVLDATLRLIADARRELRIYTRELEPAIYAHSAVVDALKQFAISGQGGLVHILIHDAGMVSHQLHPLIVLAQRLPSAFEFRAPQDPEDLQYPSVYLINDHGGYLFRLLGSRFEGDWSPTLRARNRQLNGLFDSVWERSRLCTELRALDL